MLRLPIYIIALLTNSVIAAPWTNYNPYPSWKIGLKKSKLTSNSIPCKQFTYNAPLDHFSSTNKTIPIRFWVDSSCLSCNKKSTNHPIFVQMGGEGAAGCVPCSEFRSSFPNFSGLSIAVEHRFYGESLPDGGLTPSNLKFLTTDNNTILII